MRPCAWTILMILNLAGPGGTDRVGGHPGTRPAAQFAPISGLRLDLNGRRVTLDAEVCRRTGPLEFLVCLTGTREHESILRTDVSPSDLHAAFLALGLTPGKPARWSTAGEGATFIPPQGPAVKVTLRWCGEGGEIHQAEAGRWLAPDRERRAHTPRHWIFVGSEVLPDGAYRADLEGEIVSVANFASSLLDLPFESSSADAMLEFRANSETIPPVGTKVEVVLEPLVGAENANHARVLVEIDRFGRLWLDGRAIAFERLKPWAERYVARHSKGAAVLRASARALVWDIERVRGELRAGGVREFDERIIPPSNPILPRTPAQLAASLRTWTGMFANPTEHIADPGEQAQATLAHIERRIRELETLKSVWSDYSRGLRKRLDQYRSSTAPTGGSMRE